MKAIVELRTDRLCLRKWKESDLTAFAKLNASPEVMKYFPSVLTQSESNDLALKIKTAMLEKGWGFWAVELCAEKTFIGFVGLNEPTYQLPVFPCTEIGWRLSHEHWGKGYATEAAKACLEFAFEILEKNQIYSFTAVSNYPSWHVMERLGMHNIDNNFDHPMVPESHPLREHLLCKIDRSQWNGHRITSRFSISALAPH